MIDRHNPPVDTSHAGVEQKNDFDSLQSQFDACMEKEKQGLAKTIDGESTAADLRVGQDPFVDKLQDDLDSLMQTDSIKSTSTKTLSLADADMLIGEATSFPRYSEDNLVSANGEAVVAEHAVDKRIVDKRRVDKGLEAVHQGSDSKPMFMLLLGVASAIVAALWFVAPVGSVYNHCRKPCSQHWGLPMKISL